MIKSSPVGDERLREFSLRQLKAVLRVSEMHSITHAAHTLSRSQTAVTKSVGEVEESLGVRLFDRSTTGLVPTAHGAAFSKRLNVIKNILERAHLRYQHTHKKPKPVHQIPLFTMDLSARRLATLVALGQFGDVKTAANEMRVTPSAIYKFVRELEAQLDLEIFERRPNGSTRPTEYGESLLSDIRLIFSELRHSLEDLANISGAMTGRITIGILPSTRPVIVPAALDNLLRIHPHVKIATREGPSERLLFALASGELDMVLTGTRPLSPQPGFKLRQLFEDKLCIVAGADNPLVQADKVSPSELKTARWVLPPTTTPAGQFFNNLLQEMDINPDIASIETNSIIVLRSLLIKSDFISLASMQQTEFERSCGKIKIVPCEIENDSWPIGVVLRDHTEPSPLAKAFLEQLDLITNVGMSTHPDS